MYMLLAIPFEELSLNLVHFCLGSNSVNLHQSTFCRIVVEENYKSVVMAGLGSNVAYVGNLPPEIQTRDLEELFNKFGQITATNLKIKRDWIFALMAVGGWAD